MKSIFRRTAALGAGLALTLAGFAGAPAAVAEEPSALQSVQVAEALGQAPAAGSETVLPDGSVVTILATSVNLSSTAYRVLNTSAYQLASCGAGAGGTCAINTTASATRTIQTGLSVGRATVAASLGISSATSVSLSISCNSPVFSNSGQRYVAYPAGTMYYYTITSGSSTTGILSAFNPTGISCYMR